ncbi:MAG: sporulation initiation factor Spo0A C-terminal domain-containing protein [Clostridia bacterium]|nr:sporulation initiation factor Spo0A C-terminal domain-containing protein [Clostridia bacterium]
MKKAEWVISAAEGFEPGSLAMEINGGILGMASYEYTREVAVRRMPEYLAVDMVMPGADACELARVISRSRLNANPVMLALVPRGMMEVSKALTRGLGIYALVQKPATGDELRKTVEKADIRDRLPCYGVNGDSITGILRQIGFSPARRGTRYVMTAIELLCRDMRCVKSMSGSVYPVVADIYGEDKTRIVQAMRRAMDSAWSSGSPEKQYSLFGNSIDECRGKPTLTQLCACVAERLRSGMEIDK